MEPRQKVLTPTALILLGGTGDLARNKLLPALMDLFVKGMLPEQFLLLAVSRSGHNNGSYREFVKKSVLKKNAGYSERLLDDFFSHVMYVPGAFEDSEAFMRIKEVLEQYDESIGMCTSKLFYLAVPPLYYDIIFEQLAAVKLETPCLTGNGWTRILVEKPFGSDLAHAQRLEKKLSKLFCEEQIYRIDHYLAKESLQNIIAFRFSNILFEGRWNNDFVEGVYIRVFEKGDVGTRGAFFDGVGALRDVGQNHILQMLALIAMERPKELSARELRDARTAVLRSLSMPDEKNRDMFVMGQYAGYRKTKNVDSASNTETYFALKTYLTLPRWEGVPFFLEHGKALHENSVSITVRFRPSKNCVCNNVEKKFHPNFVTFMISPEQKILLRFWVRKPGLKYELEQKELVFDRNGVGMEHESLSAEAYESVLFDALSGDQTVFVSSDEQGAAWEYVTEVLRLWSGMQPQQYRVGSAGPDSQLKADIRTLLQ